MRVKCRQLRLAKAKRLQNLLVEKERLKSKIYTNVLNSEQRTRARRASRILGPRDWIVLSPG